MIHQKKNRGHGTSKTGEAILPMGTRDTPCGEKQYFPWGDVIHPMVRSNTPYGASSFTVIKKYIISVNGTYNKTRLFSWMAGSRDSVIPSMPSRRGWVKLFSHVWWMRVGLYCWEPEKKCQPSPCPARGLGARKKNNARQQPLIKTRYCEQRGKRIQLLTMKENTAREAGRL